MAAARLASPPQQLERRPEAKAFQIDDLLHKVSDGALRIPPFQRGLKWGDSDRVDLFDSIYRGYPVGTLLFWQRAAPAAQISLGRLTVDAPARSDALWVIDGQHRLTTLAEALLGHPSAGERALYFDLVHEVFTYSKVRPSGNADKLPRVPLSVVLDSSALIEWLLSHAEIGTSQRNLAVNVGKRIREYQVPSYIVEANDDRVLRTIYRRINQSRHQLEVTDVFNALYRSQTPEPPSDLHQLAQKSLKWGFGPLAESDLLNALLAVQGIPLDRDFTDALPHEEVPAALRATTAALQQAIVFLRRDAGIAHVELLPYALPIVVLSRFFHVFPTPRARSRLRLRRWLWRGALGARLTGATVGMRQHLACIQRDDEEGSVQRLLALAGNSAAEDVRDLNGFHFARARSKLQCSALASLRPRDLVSGEPLDLPALLSSPHPEERAEKVTIIVRGQRVEKRLAQGLANRILHPRLPTPELLKAIMATEDKAALASHAISRVAQKALSSNNLDRFLELRQETLRGVIDRYFGRQAEWGADDSPSLASMIVEED
jgi:hypothetical protein